MAKWYEKFDDEDHQKNKKNVKSYQKNLRDERRKKRSISDKHSDNENDDYEDKW